MSRHSKWAKIKHGKALEDAKRGNIFTKLTRAITIATKEKGPDPATNFKLRIAIDDARAENMPKDNIERAIARASGAVGALEELHQITYEAFGPGGVALIIDAVTDNKNRTSGNVKHLVSKFGGAFATPGAVLWQFAHKGVFRITRENLPQEKEEFELALIDNGAEDVKYEEDGITIYVSQDSFAKMSDFISSKNIKLDSSGIEWVSKNTIKVEDAAVREKLNELYDALLADDDVTDVASNEI